MANDLVERLRASFIYDKRHYAADPLVEEAADRIEALEAALQEQTARADKHWRTVNDKQYMIEALVSMLGPTALTVWRGWLKKGIQRVHYSWGPDAANLSGEDRAKIMLEWDNAPRTLVSNVDAALEQNT